MADDEMTLPMPTVEKPAFDHALHPRHAASGQFVNRSDIGQALQRIHDGRPVSRAALPPPSTPDHPSTS